MGTTFFLKEHAPAHLPEVGWPTLLTLLGLSVLALLIRWRVLSELSAHPTLDLLSIGSDQRGYYQGPALDFLRGLWPGEGAFFAKPGYTFLVGWLYSLVGPSMWAVKAVQMAVGAATILLVFDLTRRIFSINAAWAAAVLWLCFPQPIFYEAQLLTHGLEPLLGFLLLWLWLRVVSDPAWGWLMLCGGTLGASALIRPSFLFLVPVLAATLLWQKGWRWIESFAHVGLVALTALAVIAPVTWHNYQASGQLQLISSEGDVTLYMGNHRDSSGFEWKLGPESTFEATSMLVALGKTTYTAQTLAEITNDPARFARLMARKTLLLLSDFEMPNNVDFVQEGLALSPTLAMLPLSFGLLMALGVTGMVLVVGHDSGVTVEPSRQSRDLRVWGTRILFCYLIVNALTVVVFLTLSRLKVPLYPALILFGGWAIAASIDLIRQRQWRWLLLTLAILVSTRLLFANTITLADTVMKPPVEPALPDYAQAHTAPIGSALTLLGHSFLPAVRPGEPVMVTLYWQSQQPIPADWMGTVQVLDSANNVIAQADHEIGAATYPRYFTSQWSPGEVVRDQYLLKIPNDAQAPIAPMLLVAAYESQTGTRAGETQIGPLAITRAEPLTVPSDAIVLGARIGNATLAAYRIQTAENRLNLTLYWRAEAPMNEDAIVFVHLLDGSQQRIGGEDIRPRHGSYSTLAWQVNEGIIDEHLIPLPAGIVINELQLAVGLYNASTQERLPTLDSQGREIGERMVRLGKMTRQAGI